MTRLTPICLVFTKFLIGIKHGLASETSTLLNSIIVCARSEIFHSHRQGKEFHQDPCRPSFKATPHKDAINVSRTFYHTDFSKSLTNSYRSYSLFLVPKIKLNLSIYVVQTLVLFHGVQLLISPVHAPSCNSPSLRTPFSRHGVGTQHAENFSFLDSCSSHFHFSCKKFTHGNLSANTTSKSIPTHTLLALSQRLYSWRKPVMEHKE